MRKNRRISTLSEISWVPSNFKVVILTASYRLSRKVIGLCFSTVLIGSCNLRRTFALDKSEPQTESQPVNSPENDGLELKVRKLFIEPEISTPVNVLEATTFQQAVESGGTG